MLMHDRVAEFLLYMGSPVSVKVNPVSGQALGEGSGTEGDKPLPFEAAFLQVVIDL